MKHLVNRWITATLAAWLLPIGGLVKGEIVIDAVFDPSKRIAIALEGFQGESLEVLKFDLEIQGFEVTSASEAKFKVAGRNSGRLEAQLNYRPSRATDWNPVFARGYKGPIRGQAHALADDIVKAVNKHPGISQTQIACIVKTGKGNEICVSDYDGGNAKIITQDGAMIRDLAWTPGRPRIYYTSYRLDNPDIYSQNLDDGSRQLIAHYSGLNAGAAPSPDGKRLAMILSKTGKLDLYIGDANGKDLQRKTRSKSTQATPCWSPDGRNICLVSNQSGPAKLFIIPAAGGSLRQLQTIGVYNATEPDWSPDGKQIAFTTQKGGRFEICVVPAEGGVVTPLTEGQDSSWAPNSRNLLFIRGPRSQRVLSLLDVPTKHVKDIAKFKESCSQPVWAR